MVKQIGTQQVSAIKGQDYQVMPVSIDYMRIYQGKDHETRASIYNRLSKDGKMVSKMDTYKKVMKEKPRVAPITDKTAEASVPEVEASVPEVETYIPEAPPVPETQQELAGSGLHRHLTDIHATRSRRTVIPFKGHNKDIPFLTFRSGRATKSADKEKITDPKQGSKMIKINTGSNRL